MVQELFKEDAELHLSYRYYRQRSSDFYKAVYDTADMDIEPYLSDDDKLGRVRTHLTGIKLASKLALFGVQGKWADVRIEALAQYLKQDTHYGDAFISQLALNIPIVY